MSRVFKLICISPDLKVGGNCQNNVSTHLIEIYNIDNVIFESQGWQSKNIFATTSDFKRCCILILYLPLSHLLHDMRESIAWAKEAVM